MDFRQYAVIDDHMTVNETEALAAIAAAKRVLVIGDANIDPAVLRAATFAYANRWCSEDGSRERPMFDAVNAMACMIDTGEKVVRADDGMDYPFSDPEQAMEIVRQWFDGEIDPVEF